MVKIADSAAMRQYIPTTPRSGRIHGRARGSGTDMALMKISFSFVLPIRVFGMLQVPKRAPAAHFGNNREVVSRWRRSGAPLERPRIPRIIAGERTSKIRPREVPEKNQDSYCL